MGKNKLSNWQYVLKHYPVFLVFSVCLFIMAANNGSVEAATSKLAMKYKDYNIVFVSFDAMQARHMHAFGYPKDITPTIDGMANQGYTFTNAMSVSSWTVPASMTWFTGVYPTEHRILNKFHVYEPPVKQIANLKELSPNIVTLAEVLKENGYITGGFTGDAGVSGVFGYNQGFDVYSDKVKFGDMEQSVPKALEWLGENKDKKFFLFLHGYDSHGQCEPEGEFDYRYVDPNYRGKYTGAKEEQEALREEGLANGHLHLQDDDVTFWRAIYDEKINRTDERFKRFLQGMEKLGLMDKTLFVLTSDHGTEFYEHKRFDHGFSLYGELLNIPLVIKLPGQTEGKVIKDFVGTIDLMPTILDLLDVKVSENVQQQMRGASLVSALQGEPVDRDVYAETNYRLFTYKRAVITQEGWKFIYTLESKDRELYNLNDDPQELKNVVDKQPRIAYELEAKLFAYYKALGHDLTKEKWETGLSPVYASQAKGWRKK
jgi:arylsulfatase A-like enzyme